MDCVLNGQIGLDDFIFVHCKGQTKDVEITKMDEMLGLTITDNGNGYSFIKKIKDGSLIDAIKFVSVGDHIEKINDESLVGCRHFEVANKLKNIIVGSTFTIRLIEPCKAGFALIGPRETKRTSNVNTTGRETLRLRNKGPPIFEQVQESLMNLVNQKINVLIESYMGISDNELAFQIWEIGNQCANPSQFILAIEQSDLKMFQFNEEFLFDLWGVVDDIKCGRFDK